MQSLLSHMGQQRHARNEAYRKLESINTRLMYLQEEYQIQRLEELEKMEKFSRDPMRNKAKAFGRRRTTASTRRAQ